jgi:carbon monoxide dehydrogenase subunit G
MEWRQNRWYRYRTWRVDKDDTGYWQWLFTVLDYKTREETQIGTIRTASEWIKQAVVFTETGYGVTCDTWITVNWSNPIYRCTTPGEFTPEGALATYNGTCPEERSTDQKLTDREPFQWWHRTGRVRKLANGSAFGSAASPSGDGSSSDPTLPGPCSFRSPRAEPAANLFRSQRGGAVANTFEVSVDIGVPADQAWQEIGDPANVGWFPPIAACEVKDGYRYAAMVDGRNLVERIVAHDDATRSYTYSVEEGTSVPLASHSATLRVEETGEGSSRVLWRTEAEPEDPSVDLEQNLSRVMQKGLENLKSLLEAGAE